MQAQGAPPLPGAHDRFNHSEVKPATMAAMLE